MSSGRNLRQVGDRVETLIGEIHEIADEPTRARAEELVGLLVDLYGAGLERIAEILSEDGAQGRASWPSSPTTARGQPVGAARLHPVDVDARSNRRSSRFGPTSARMPVAWTTWTSTTRASSI